MDQTETQTVKKRYPRRNLAACMLPWTEKFELNVPVFEQQVQAAVDDGYESLYLMGTAGEGYALSESRFKQVVEIFAARTTGKGLDPQIGVIGLSMEQIVYRIALAHDLGIRMFQISLPSWGALDETETMLFSRQFVVSSLTAAFCTTTCPVPNGSFGVPNTTVSPKRFQTWSLPRTARPIMLGPMIC